MLNSQMEENNKPLNSWGQANVQGNTTGVPLQTPPLSGQGVVWQPATQLDAFLPELRQEEEQISTAGFLCMLVAGLLPVIGAIIALRWAFGSKASETKRNFAKAILWLHGIALVAVLIALCVWVLGLARNVAPLL